MIWIFIGLSFCAVTLATYLCCFVIKRYNQLCENSNKHAQLIGDLTLAHGTLVHHVMQSDAIIIELREDMVIKENLH